MVELGGKEGLPLGLGGDELKEEVEDNELLNGDVSI